MHLEIKNHQPSTDNVWRIPAADSAEIELVTEPWTTQPENIEWFALMPKYSRCNLTDLSGDQAGFVANAAARPAWNEFAIDHHDSVLPVTKVDGFFDRQLHCGSLRLRARAVVDGKIRDTPTLELRRFVSSGFRAAISEQFGLPYRSAAANCQKVSIRGRKPILGPIARTSSFTHCAVRETAFRGRTQSNCVAISI